MLLLDTSKIPVELWVPGVLLLVSSPAGKGFCFYHFFSFFFVGLYFCFFGIFYFLILILGVPNLIDATNSLKKGGLFVVGSILVGQWNKMMRYLFSPFPFSFPFLVIFYYYYILLYFVNFILVLTKF